MNLKEAMQMKNFVVVGDTINEKKYAYKIKNQLLAKEYNVAAVGKELKSINEVDFDIDILDLCINPVAGLKLLKENKKTFKNIVIQPGAESEEIIKYLRENKLPYIESCLLVGLRLY
ncbi:CoA-binding protein [Fusobacterium sp. IOR10]|uniref:CoA-binding protein n=1 Tax=Fusobacterium sp. IOR10 TaxID=2665157 RepID=UPI0013D06F9B|nr:CoA-binding protein [Fusobacterium sp. IOR10]